MYLVHIFGCCAQCLPARGFRSAGLTIRLRETSWLFVAFSPPASVLAKSAAFHRKARMSADGKSFALGTGRCAALALFVVAASEPHNAGQRITTFNVRQAHVHNIT
jgi:hypothetical protein